MAILRKAPNGEIVSFEDGTSEEVIAATLNKKEYEHPDKGAAVDFPDGLKNNWLYDNLAVAPYEASRKFINSTTGLVEGIGDTLGELTNVGGFKYGKDAKNNIVEYVPYDKAVEQKDVYGILSPITGKIGVKDAFNIKGFFYDPTDPTNDHHTRTLTAKFVEGGLQFLIGYKGVDKFFKSTLGLTTATTKTGVFAEVTAKGAIADFVAFDENSGRITDLLAEFAPETADKYLSYLQSDPDDTFWEGRLKNSIEGIGVGAFAEVLFRGLRYTKNGLRGLTKSKEAIKDKKVIDKFHETMDTIKDKLEDTTSLSEKMKIMNEAVDSTLKKEFKTTKKTIKSDADRARILLEIADNGLKRNFEKWQRGELSVEEAFNIPEGFINLETFRPDKAGKGGISFEGLKTFKAFYDAVHAVKKRKVFTDEAVKRKAVNEYGNDVNKVFQDFAKFADNVEDTSALIFAHEVAYTSLLNAFPKFIRGYKSGKRTFKDMQLMYFMLENMGNNAGRVRTASGRNLRVFQLTKEEFSNARLIEDQILEANNAYKNFGGGQEGFERFLEQAARADEPNALRKVIQLTWRNKTWNVLNEYWINALLSSPKTQAVNALSNGFVMGIRPIEDIIGNKISQLISQSDHVKAKEYKLQLDESAERLVGLVSYIRDANKYAYHAFRNGELILQKGDVAAGKIDTALNKSIPDSFGGKWIRMPSRFLNATDEWFKQINYRAKLNAQAIREGKRLNLKGKKLSKFQDEYFKQGFDETGTRGVNEEALLYAEENTFTNELIGSSAKFQDWILANPFMKQFFPFVKTPFNIAKAILDRTPIGGIYRFKHILGTSGDPRMIAKARGQLAVGSFILGSAYFLAQNGVISSRTGYKGEKSIDPYKNAEMLRLKKSATGFKPYSIKIGDWQWHFGQLDPIGALFGIMADFVEYRDQMTEEEIERIGVDMQIALANGEDALNGWQDTQIAIGATAKALRSNVLSKTYLQAINEVVEGFMSEEPHKFQRYINNKAASYVPNIFKKFVNDPYFRDARGFFDNMKKSTGIGQPPSPRYNAIGEPHMDKDGFANRMFKNMFNIFGTQKLHKDIVAEEILKLGKGFPNMKEYMNNVHYKSYKKGKFTAWDAIHKHLREVRVNGKTLRQRLEEEIQKESYQNLSEPVSIGKQMVSTTGKYDRLKFIYGKFLEKAKLEFEKEKGDFIHIDNEELSLKQAEKNQKKNIKILKQPSSKNNPFNQKKLLPILEWTAQ